MERSSKLASADGDSYMKRPAILLIDLNMFFGGGQVYLLQLADLLQGRADLFAFCINPKVAKLLEEHGVKSVTYPWALNIGKPIHMLLCMFIVLRFRLFHGVNVVWANGIPDIAAMPAARLLGCTAFATRHLTLEIEVQDWYRGAKRRAAELLYRAFAGSAHKIVCVSQAVADDLARIVSPDKLVVIRNWVSSLPEPAHDYRQSNEVVRLLYVGRLQKYKGASTILEAMRRIDSKGEAGRLSLTIVGEGRYREELETEAKGLNVTFAGFQADPTPYYLSADVFVNPSIGPEGLPLVSLEAMSHGLTCILSDLPVHKEITSDGQAALLFRAGNVDDLTAKLEELLSSHQLFEHYGRSARQQIETWHVAPSARERYLKLIFSN
jgi:glycosyltransferase involved in cell wall biosynthesis